MKKAEKVVKAKCGKADPKAKATAKPKARPVEDLTGSSTADLARQVVALEARAKRQTLAAPRGAAAREALRVVGELRRRIKALAG